MTLTPIAGGRAPERVGSVALLREHSGKAPSAVDAVVLEEDRYLTLSAPVPVELHVDKNPLRTLTRAFDAEPAELGTLVLRQGRPLTMLAVVVDVDAEPAVDEAHVRRALERVLAVCVAQRCARVRVPLLGRQGGLPAVRCAAVLRDVLSLHSGDHPLELVVSVRDDADDDALAPPR